MPMPVGGRLGRSSRFIVEYDYRDGLDRNGLLVFRSGQIPSFSRGGTVNAAMAMDRRGIFHAVGPQTPRLHHQYDAASGLWVPRGIALEPEVQNIALGSCSFGDSTYWTNNDFPSQVAVPSCLFGRVATLYTNPTVGQALRQNVGVFVNGQTDCAWWLVDVGATPPTSTEFGIIDYTLVAYLARIYVTWSTLALTDINAPAAKDIIPLGGGRYLIWMTATGTAAGTGAAGNIRTMNATPARAGAGSITIHMGQFEPAQTEPHLPIVTLGSAITRAADAWDVPFNVPASALQATGVAIYEDYTLTARTPTTGALSLGSPGIAAASAILCYNAANGTYRSRVSIASVVTSESTVAVASAIGDRIERLTTVTPSGVITVAVSVNRGAVSVGAPGAAGGWPASFTNARAYLTDEATAARKGGMVRQRAVIVPGTSWTIDQLRSP